jgi:hypothetical protein
LGTDEEGIPRGYRGGLRLREISRGVAFPSLTTNRASVQVRWRDGSGCGLDIPARMHGQQRMDRGWILGRLLSSVTRGSVSCAYPKDEGSISQAKLTESQKKRRAEARLLRDNGIRKKITSFCVGVRELLGR